MSVEAQIYASLKSLVDNRVFRDVASQTNPALNRIVFQQVGGESVNFLEGGRPSKKNARFQITCWGSRRDDVMALSRRVEDTLRTVTALSPTVLGAAIAVYDEETKSYGAIQDFSLWYDD